MNEFELKILDFIQNTFKCEFLDMLMPIITRLANSGIFWIALAVLFLLIKRTRKTGLSMAVALILGFIIGNIVLKNVVGRIRPYDVNTDFALLIHTLKDYSFPSGHTLCSFEGAVCIFIRNKKWGVAALVLASLIAFSRLYLYVHYPTDVLAGIILGTLFALAGTFFADKFFEKIENRKQKRNTES